jgi:hypothetical protein
MLQHMVEQCATCVPRTTILFQDIPLEPWESTVLTRNGHWVYTKTDGYAFVSVPRRPGKPVRV